MSHSKLLIIYAQILTLLLILLLACFVNLQTKYLNLLELLASDDSVTDCLSKTDTKFYENNIWDSIFFDYDIGYQLQNLKNNNN